MPGALAEHEAVAPRGRTAGSRRPGRPSREPAPGRCRTRRRRWGTGAPRSIRIPPRPPRPPRISRLASPIDCAPAAQAVAIARTVAADAVLDRDVGGPHPRQHAGQQVRADADPAAAAAGNRVRFQGGQPADARDDDRDPLGIDVAADHQAGVGHRALRGDHGHDARIGRRSWPRSAAAPPWRRVPARCRPRRARRPADGHPAACAARTARCRARRSTRSSAQPTGVTSPMPVMTAASVDWRVGRLGAGEAHEAACRCRCRIRNLRTLPVGPSTMSSSGTTTTRRSVAAAAGPSAP